MTKRISDFDVLFTDEHIARIRKRMNAKLHPNWELNSRNDVESFFHEHARKQIITKGKCTIKVPWQQHTFRDHESFVFVANEDCYVQDRASPGSSPVKSWDGRIKAEAAGSAYDNKTIHKLKTFNPRKKGTHGHRSWELITDGMLFTDYIKAGGRMNDLRWDIERKHIELREQSLNPNQEESNYA